MEHAVDIIIPVYNALADLKVCLESLYRYTDLEKNRLILINDNSPDDNVRPYLDEQKNAHIIVIHNTENKGFSANINIGMAQSQQNDVVLLNSDTILTAGWLEKMTVCAYSDPAIGTVTPLSNNATLCSVPEFCKENRLPDGMNIDQAGRIVERCSFRTYPEITVAHGFCMYVKREVIDVIGNFDAEAFGRGYGEENDFCNRAEQVGYRHVMCDDTYIYHSGTKSFVSKEKEEYIREHEKILNKRYPIQMHNNAVHCRDNPNQMISENVGIYFELCNQKKNLLYLVQSDFRDGASDNVGGTQLHVKDLVYQLKEQYNIFVVARDGEELAVTAYIGEKEVLFRFDMPQEHPYPRISEKNMVLFWRNILTAFQINLIHIHHVYGLSFDVFDEAKRLDIPVIVTLHDFYFICPTIKLLDDKQTVCIGRDSADRCRECLRHQLDYADTVDFISVWRKRCEKYLGQAARIIVPSESAKDIILRYYPDIEDTLSVVEHGCHVERDKRRGEEAVYPPYGQNKKIRAAFIGGLNAAKGGEKAVEIIRKSSEEIAWFVFGEIGVQSLRDLERDNLIKTGAYQPEELPRLLREYRIDVVCILSLWPETYSYTLTEAVTSGIPVIVTDVGALGERVRNNGYGWTVNLENPTEEVTELLNAFLSNPEQLKQARQKLKNISVKSAAEMLEDYAEIYANYRRDKTIDGNFDPAYIYRGYAKANHAENGEETIGIARHKKLEEAYSELNWLKTTLSYKIMIKAMRMRFPFKNTIIKLLKK